MKSCVIWAITWDGKPKTLGKLEVPPGRKTMYHDQITVTFIFVAEIHAYSHHA